MNPAIQTPKQKERTKKKKINKKRQLAVSAGNAEQYAHQPSENQTTR